MSKEEIWKESIGRNRPCKTIGFIAMDVYAKQTLGEAVELLKRSYKLNKDDMGFDVDVTDFLEKIGETP